MIDVSTKRANSVGRYNHLYIVYRSRSSGCSAHFAHDVPHLHKLLVFSRQNNVDINSVAEATIKVEWEYINWILDAVYLSFRWPWWSRVTTAHRSSLTNLRSGLNDQNRTPPTNHDSDNDLFFLSLLVSFDTSKKRSRAKGLGGVIFYYFSKKKILRSAPGVRTAGAGGV